MLADESVADGAAPAHARRIHHRRNKHNTIAMPASESVLLNRLRLSRIVDDGITASVAHHRSEKIRVMSVVLANVGDRDREASPARLVAGMINSLPSFATHLCEARWVRAMVH